LNFVKTETYVRRKIF